MMLDKKKYVKIFSILFIIIIIALFINIIIGLTKENNEIKAKEPIIINLLTAVHPALPWSFKAKESKIEVVPGEVKTIEYIVENLEDKESTGIATFAYFPSQFGIYIFIIFFFFTVFIFWKAI